VHYHYLIPLIYGYGLAHTHHGCTEDYYYYHHRRLLLQRDRYFKRRSRLFVAINGNTVSNLSIVSVTDVQLHWMQYVSCSRLSGIEKNKHEHSACTRKVLQRFCTETIFPVNVFSGMEKSNNNEHE
jgi:hypothetical protein